MNLYYVEANWTKKGATNYVRGGKTLEGSFAFGHFIGAIVAAETEEMAIEQTRPKNVPAFSGQDKDQTTLKNACVVLHSEGTKVKLIGLASEGIGPSVLCTFDPRSPLQKLDQ
jgi:hypothetical protein